MVKISLFLTLILTPFFTSKALAQEADNQSYFRIFTVEVSGLTESERTNLENTYREKSHFSIDKSSNAKSNVLVVKVSADYPKRVRDIKTELKDLATAQIPVKRIKKIEENKQQE